MCVIAIGITIWQVDAFTRVQVQRQVRSRSRCIQRITVCFTRFPTCDGVVAEVVVDNNNIVTATTKDRVRIRATIDSIVTFACGDAVIACIAKDRVTIARSFIWVAIIVIDEIAIGIARVASINLIGT